MTPAELARANAITLECKKDALQQRQSGDWKISFTVQSADMDDRITRAPMGTRYQAVLVEIDDNEMPVRKEVRPDEARLAAQPRPKDKPAGAKRPWEDMLPSAQAAMLGDKPAFGKFLASRYPDDWSEALDDPAECVRLICGVGSRADLNTNHRARVAWHSIDVEFKAWEMMGQ